MIFNIGQLICQVFKLGHLFCQLMLKRLNIG